MRLISKIVDRANLAVISAIVFLQNEAAYAGAFGEGASAAQDGTGVAIVATNIQNQSQTIGPAVKWGGFAVGSLLIAAGLLKLKQAADTQGQQVKYGDGIWRLAIGGALAALPAVMQTSADTLGMGTGSDLDNPFADR